MRIAQVVIVILGIVILVCGIVMGGTDGPDIVRMAGPVVAIGGLLVGLTSLLLTHKKTT